MYILCIYFPFAYLYDIINRTDDFRVGIFFYYFFLFYYHDDDDGGDHLRDIIYKYRKREKI